jgi:TusA-related sulfurtransferase
MLKSLALATIMAFSLVFPGESLQEPLKVEYNIPITDEVNDKRNITARTNMSESELKLHKSWFNSQYLAAAVSISILASAGFLGSFSAVKPMAEVPSNFVEPLSKASVATSLIPLQHSFSHFMDVLRNKYVDIIEIVKPDSSILERIEKLQLPNSLMAKKSVETAPANSILKVYSDNQLILSAAKSVAEFEGISVAHSTDESNFAPVQVVSQEISKKLQDKDVLKRLSAKLTAPRQHCSSDRALRDRETGKIIGCRI